MVSLAMKLDKPTAYQCQDPTPGTNANDEHYMLCIELPEVLLSCCLALGATTSASGAIYMICSPCLFPIHNVLGLLPLENLSALAMYEIVYFR